MSRRTLLAAVGASAVATPVRGQPIPVRPTYPVFASPPATHVLSRGSVEPDGAPYVVFRAIPRGKPPREGWPSLWMLDGNAALNRLTGAELEAHPGLAVFGVGYPVDVEFAGEERTRDYTPEAAGPRADPRRPERETGGDRQFRARLVGPIREYAEAVVPIDPARRSLWGHSFGGLFVLTTLLGMPEAFGGWIAVSPSLWFAPQVLAALEASAAPAPHGRSLLILAGGGEARSDTPAADVGSRDAIALAGRLGGQGRILAGLGHGETFAASFGTALGFAAGFDRDVPSVER